MFVGLVSSKMVMGPENQETGDKTSRSEKVKQRTLLCDLKKSIGLSETEEVLEKNDRGSRKTGGKIYKTWVFRA